MKLFARAIVTGFGLSLGSALYKKVAKHFGFDKDDDKKDASTETQRQDGATDPGLHGRVPS
ncbi:MAG: hypothetical protein JWO36_1131 [Myxococcales bacterium]|nr:hypothetical protein [Myxococcales bacterium]